MQTFTPLKAAISFKLNEPAEAVRERRPRLSSIQATPMLLWFLPLIAGERRCQGGFGAFGRSVCR